MDWIVERKLKANPKLESDIQRICRLPIAEPLSDEEIDAIQRVYVKPRALENGFRLQRVQAEAIQAFVENEGLFAPIAVGGGKTLVSLACIGIAIEQGLQRVMLFVPPQVYVQLVEHDIAWARRRVKLGCSFYLFGGKSQRKRAELAGHRTGCWIMPYSLLSARDSFEILEAVKPQMMVFDEAHALKNRKTSARTRRILSYWRKYRPLVIALSGTMTSKSLKDYSHILQMCLRDGAPIPVETQAVDDWAAVLDSDQVSQEGHHNRSTNTGPLRPLINWSNANFPKTPLQFDIAGFRRAFQNRLLTTPGVVSSPPDQIGTSLTFTNKKAEAPKPALLKLIDNLNNLWVTPDGDEIEHAMLIWKWKQELTTGFYNSLQWPDAGQLCDRRGLDVKAAEDLLAASKQHHKMQQLYHKELRTWFRSHPHRPGLDTPMLVGSDMLRNQDRNVGSKLYEAWLEARNYYFNGIVERDSVPVRVCDYKLKQAISWCRATGRSQGIIWYFHQAVGEWLTEILEDAGIPVVHCPAGKAFDAFLIGDGAADRCRGKFLVCSLAAHGTGKNLQYMTDQLFIQLPPTEQLMQQSVGRTHRKGQESDEVQIQTLISNEIDEMALAALLNDATYVFETQNDSRKLLIGTWNPMPTIYASSVLQRAGIQAKILNARQQQLLSERFTTEKKAEGNVA